MLVADRCQVSSYGAEYSLPLLLLQKHSGTWSNILQPGTTTEAGRSRRSFSEYHSSDSSSYSCCHSINSAKKEETREEDHDDDTIFHRLVLLALPEYHYTASIFCRPGGSRGRELWWRVPECVQRARLLCRTQHGKVFVPPRLGQRRLLHP